MCSRSSRLLATLAFVAATALSGALRSEAGSFTSEVVDSAAFATAAKLVTTPSGELVLSIGALGGTPAYYLPGGGTPYSGRVFERAGAVWQPSAAPPPVDVSLPHALAVDGDGWRHFVSWRYPVSDSSRPLLQDEGPGGWTATELDTSIVNGLGITIDGRGQLWVAWLRGRRINCCLAPPYELLIAHRTPQGWSRDSLEVPFLPYYTPYPLAVDAAGRAHVLFVGAGLQGLHHAVRTAGGWETTLVDGSTTIGGQEPKLLPGPDGSVHALYRAGAELRYARYSAGQWQVETLPYEMHWWSQFDLALDKAGRPRIAFFGECDYAWPCLLYAHRPGTEWVSALASYWVDTMRGGLCLALDEFDRAAIAFPGPGYREVSVATQAGTADVTPRIAVPGGAVGLAIASGNPSPLGGTMLWRLSLPEAASVTLEAFDLAGRRLASSPAWPAPRGESTIRWTPAALPSGSFFVRASAAGNRSRAVQVFVAR